MSFKNSWAALKHFAHVLGDPDDIDYTGRFRIVRIPIPPDVAAQGTAVASAVAAAAALQTECAILMTGVAAGSKPIHLVNVDLLPLGAVTANDTDYITLALQLGDLAAGALASAITSFTTKSTGGTVIAANTKINMYNATDGGTAIAAAKRCSFNITKAGAGKVWPGCLLEATYTID